MPETPHLRPVRLSDAELGEAAAPAPERRGPPRRFWLPIALGIALVGGLILLGWRGVQLGQQIAELEARNEALQQHLLASERVIEAQRGRLDQVRTGLDRVRALLDEPLPE